MKFSELHDKLTQYTTKLISKEDLDSWLFENVNIITYIPITQKYVYLKIINDAFSKKMNDYIQDKKDAELIYELFDMFNMFDICFRYVDIKLDDKDKVPDNYDLLIQSGFYEYLKKNIGKDIDVFEEMFVRTSGINDINIMSIIRAAIDSTIKTEDIEKARNLFKGLSKEKLNAIAKFEEYNNPAIKTILDNAKKQATEETNKKMKEKLTEKDGK